jgi:hypothetical protein
MHPQLDIIDQILRIIGWPALLSILVWAIRTYDKGQVQFHEMEENTKTAVATVEQVKTMVSVMQTNHLAHLQSGIEQVAKSNDKAVEVLGRIDTNIQILADRNSRA